MSDPFKKVQAGDPLRIPAAAYNLFDAAARDFQQRAHGLGQGSMPSSRQATGVPVRSNTGADRSRFHVVGLQAALIAPAANERAFRQRAAFDAVTSDLLKGGFTVLTGKITLGSARSARQLVAGTISADALAAGDVLEIEADAVSGGGTMGKGVFAYVDLEGDYD